MAALLEQMHRSSDNLWNNPRCPMKKRLRVGILFGGKSGEHEVSIMSAASIFNALDKDKYDVTMIGIDKSGRWLLPDQSRVLAEAKNPRLVLLNKMADTVSPVPFEAKK